jgi:hypothetical protein
MTSAITAPTGYLALTQAMPFLGRVECSHTQVEAGSWQEILLEITIGSSGLADGGAVKATFKFYSDWALFQTGDPLAANYVTAEYQARPLLPGETPASVQSLACRFDQKGHERPFQKAIIIDVVDGYVNAGDRITLRLGDRRFGGPGTRVQSFAEREFRFRCYIDPLGTSRYAAIPGDIVLDIAPGPPARLLITTPRMVRPGIPCPAFIRAEDEWGNACVDLDAHIALTISLDGGQHAPHQHAFPRAGWSVVRFDDLPTAHEGELALRASLPGVPRCAPAEAFIAIDAACPADRMIFADLHVHSDDTVGTGNAAYNLAYGRDVAGLDVLGYTVNDFNITEDNWNHAVALIEAMDEPGRFVCYPGTEWCGNSAAGGDHNVVFLRGGTKGFPRAEDGRTVRCTEWNDAMQGEPMRAAAWPLDQLYAAYAHDPEGYLLIPHVGGRRCNLAWHHPELERLVEIGSAWGHFPWLIEDALQRGYRVGVCANGDEHRGRCGGGAPGTQVFGVRGGLTGIIAGRLDRPAVGAALRARHSWATTGERAVALLWSGDAIQGGSVAASGPLQVNWRILNEAGWENVSAWDQDGCLWRRDLVAEAGLSSRRIRLSWGGARIRDRYRAALWEGRLTIRNGTIRGVRPAGLDHREEVVWRDGATIIGFRSDTAGDTDSVEVDIEGLADCTLEVCGTIGGYKKIGDAREPVPFVHCPTFSWNMTGAALLAERRLRKGLPGIDMGLSLERMTEFALPRDVAGTFDLSPVNGPHGFRPVYVRAEGAAADKAMTSPLFVHFDGTAVLD